MEWVVEDVQWATIRNIHWHEQQYPERHYRSLCNMNDQQFANLDKSLNKFDFMIRILGYIELPSNLDSIAFTERNKAKPWR